MMVAKAEQTGKMRASGWRAAVPVYKCQKCSWSCDVRHFAFSIIHGAWESFPCPLKDTVFRKKGWIYGALCSQRWKKVTASQKLAYLEAYTVIVCVSIPHFFIMSETCESQTPRNWFLLSSTNLSNLFQRYIQTLISYLFAGFFFPPNPCCQCLVTWTTQLLYAGKQKRFVFIDCMTGVSWSIAYAGKLLSYQQSDFWRHANSPFAAALKLGAKP